MILRTPEARFENLPELPFSPHYASIADEVEGELRVHYLDEGPRAAPIVLLIHGEPTWAFLYRKVIRALVDAGLRAIAPDLIGFGRSDKIARRDFHTYGGHVARTAAFLRALDLRDLTLVCQDWGGLIGLRVVAENEDRFARVVVANTSLPTGDRTPPDTFLAWQRASQHDPVFSAGEIVRRYCRRPLSDAAAAAYDAPFPDESFKAGPRQLPLLVPIRPDDPASEPNRRAWEALGRFERPFLTVFGDGDPFTSGMEKIFQKRVPGARGQDHRVLSGVGHFIQEDAGEELGRLTAQFVERARA